MAASKAPDARFIYRKPLRSVGATIVNKVTYNTYKAIAKRCAAEHGAEREDVSGDVNLVSPLGALKVKKEGVQDKYNEIVGALMEMRRKHPIPPKKLWPVHRKSDEALGFLLSDLHFGKFSEIDNEVVFSLDIAKQRFNDIIENAKHLWSAYMKEVHEIEDVHIFLAGDLIDGEQIYRTQAWNSELPVVKQVTFAADLIKNRLLTWASKEFTNVVVHAVQGNHGEVRDAAGESTFHWATNFDTVLANMLEFGCAELPNVTFDIGYDRIHIAKVRKFKVPGEHRFLMMHKGPGTPQTAYGRSRYGGWYQRFRYDAVLTGHYHNFSMNNFNGIPILQNGALFGSADDYTMNLAFDGFPCQTLFSISDKRPLAHIWPVDLR